MKTIRITFTILLVGVFLTINAQSNYFKKAKEAEDSGRYFYAIDLYKKAFIKSPAAAEKGLILFNIGNSYVSLLDWDQAQIYYQKAQDAHYENPDLELNLARVLKAQGKYDEAIFTYSEYLLLDPENGQVQNELAGCEESLVWMNNPTMFIVSPEVLLNTSGYDFCPRYVSGKYDELAFCSTRESATGEDMTEAYGENYQDIFLSVRDRNGKWSEPVPLQDPVNSEHHEGAAWFNSKGTEMYFTRCPDEDNPNLGCDIYRCRKQGSGWTEPELIQLKPEGADTLVMAHPMLTPDGQNLLFVSDMEGGFGGKDIWMATFDSSSEMFVNVVNLGSEVNTTADESYPFLRKDGTLYFSSTGHIGMGGMDIFSAEQMGHNVWGNITNLQYPINSCADDFGLIMEADEERGYFSSNREDGRGSDDIYSYYLKPPLCAIDVQVVDDKTNNPIPLATLTLTNSHNNEIEVTTDENGWFTFGNSDDEYLDLEVSYQLVATANQYLKGTTSFDCIALKNDTKYIREFRLSGGNTAFPMPTVLYEFDKWELLVNDAVNSEDSLEYLYTVLTENPTIMIQLRSHTDSRGSKSYNQALSEKRAQSCVEYLISRGIDPARIIPIGMGENELLITDEEIAMLQTQEEISAAHQANRRTDFKVISWDFQPQ